jgi:hypothetical protein
VIEVYQLLAHGRWFSLGTVIEVYQLLAHGRWFPPGTPVSSTTKTGCHDIVEILLKVALNTKNHSINHMF